MRTIVFVDAEEGKGGCQRPRSTPSHTRGKGNGRLWELSLAAEGNVQGCGLAITLCQTAPGQQPPRSLPRVPAAGNELVPCFLAFPRSTSLGPISTGVLASFPTVSLLATKLVWSL